MEGSLVNRLSLYQVFGATFRHFIPSLLGNRHHWSENSEKADNVLDAQVFADAAERILRIAG